MNRTISEKDIEMRKDEHVDLALFGYQAEPILCSTDEGFKIGVQWVLRAADLPNHVPDDLRVVITDDEHTLNIIGNAAGDIMCAVILGEQVIESGTAAYILGMPGGEQLERDDVFTLAATLQDIGTDYVDLNFAR